MRYQEIKIKLHEESKLNSGDLDRADRPGRLEAFLDIVKNGVVPTSTVPDGKQFKTDPNYYKNPANLENLKKTIKSGQKWFDLVGFIDGSDKPETVNSINLKKFPGAGARASVSKDNEVGLSNVGETSEILHAAAVYARLISGTKPIQVSDVQRVIDQLSNGKELKGEALDIKSKDFDEFIIKVRAADDIWKDIKRKDILTHPKIKGLVANAIVPDANDNTGEYAKTYATNGEYDSVAIEGDGLSDQKGTKADITFYNKVTGKRAKFSLKANTTKELHSAGLGPIDAEMTERFRIVKDFFGDLDIDISGEKGVARAEFESSKDIFSANVIAFRQAHQELSSVFQADFDRKERNFMNKFLATLKKWAVKDEDGMDVKQFTSKGYYVLDINTLQKLADDKNFNFTLEYTSEQSPKYNIPLPKIRFNDPDGNDFLTIRTYALGSKKGVYLKVKVDKGKSFVKLTTKKTNIK